jgi:two-component system response regulator DevR
MSGVKIAVVDDHMVVHDGIRAMAERTSDIEFCGGARNRKELTELLAREEPDVLLLDLRLGDDDGLDICALLHRRLPGMQILVFTAFGDELLLREALRAGAVGYVLKETSTRDLPDVIRQLREAGSYFDPRLAGRALLSTFGDRPTTGVLSAREARIVRLISAGRTNGDIAQQLAISPHTVKFHVSDLLKRFGLARRAELVTFAFEHHLLEPLPAERHSGGPDE